MNAFLLISGLVLLAAPAAKAPRPSRDAGVDSPLTAILKPAPRSHAAPTDTRCSACHVTSAWTDVRFNHDRTGFPLTGVHSSTPCKACHADDFEKKVPSSCAGCHRDVHAGDLGARCDGCHDTANWASRFNADAHRRSAFPLVGGHATLPCLECHAAGTDRRFARAAVECAGCHQRDVDRTRGTAVDHAALQFTSNCRTCHNAFRFTPALFPGHDRCYVISSGSHAQMACLSCHTTLTGLATTAGACATRTAACTGCHEHKCAGPGGALETDRKHQPPETAVPVPGYQCQDRKCYQCHKQVAP